MSLDDHACAQQRTTLHRQACPATSGAAPQGQRRTLLQKPSRSSCHGVYSLNTCAHPVLPSPRPDLLFSPQWIGEALAAPLPCHAAAPSHPCLHEQPLHPSQRGLRSKPLTTRRVRGDSRTLVRSRRCQRIQHQTQAGPSAAFAMPSEARRTHASGRHSPRDDRRASAAEPAHQSQDRRLAPPGVHQCVAEIVSCVPRPKFPPST
jgi:hypothetical protein